MWRAWGSVDVLFVVVVGVVVGVGVRLDGGVMQVVWVCSVCGAGRVLLVLEVRLCGLPDFPLGGSDDLFLLGNVLTFVPGSCGL